jgi:phosphatidylserine decarboxylase
VRLRDLGRIADIAATDAGTVQQSEKARTPGARLEKGDEVGLFEFSGSSIIVVFEEGKIVFDEDSRSISK